MATTTRPAYGGVPYMYLFYFLAVLCISELRVRNAWESPIIYLGYRLVVPVLLGVAHLPICLTAIAGIVIIGSAILRRLASRIPT
jgi:hypothetical protein